QAHARSSVPSSRQTGKATETSSIPNKSASHSPRLSPPRELRSLRELHGLFAGLPHAKNSPSPPTDADPIPIPTAPPPPPPPPHPDPTPTPTAPLPPSPPPYTDRPTKSRFIATKSAQILPTSILDVGCDQPQLLTHPPRTVRYPGLDIAPPADIVLNLDTP